MESHISHISEKVLQRGQFTHPQLRHLKTQIKFRKGMQTSLYLSIIPELTSEALSMQSTISSLQFR